MLGIVLHGAVAFMADPMPELLWPAMDRSRSPIFDALFWWIHGFRIPLFFLIAGFFAMRLHDSRGRHGFAANRLRRVGLPFLLACLVILPITYYAWSLGWLITGRCTVDEILAWKFHDQAIQRNFKGPAHLWFLEYLLIIYAAFLIVRAGWARLSGREGIAAPADADSIAGRHIGWFERLLISPLRPLIFAVPTAAILALEPAVFRDFRNTFAPDPAGLAYYGVFFAVGCALQRSSSQLPDLQRGAWVCVLATFPLLALVLNLSGRHADGEIAPLSLEDRALLAGSISLLAWLGVFGWLGVFMRIFSSERPAMRYVADASYWVYLVHLPIVGLLHVALLRAPWHAAVKFAIVVAAAVAITLLSYHVLVRGTVIGRLLAGRSGGGGSENRQQSGLYLGQDVEDHLQEANPVPIPPGHSPAQTRRIST